jgi:hypothetical protein
MHIIVNLNIFTNGTETGRKDPFEVEVLRTLSGERVGMND